MPWRERQSKEILLFEEYIETTGNCIDNKSKNQLIEVFTKIKDHEEIHPTGYFDIPVDIEDITPIEKTGKGYTTHFHVWDVCNNLTKKDFIITNDI